MAETVTKPVLEMDLEQPIESINTLRAAVKAAREEYNAAALGSKEYDAALEKLTTAQNALTNATRLGTKTIDETDQSYNALSLTMADLKKQWKATNDEAERNRLGKKILDLNNRLKALDATTGNHQRNVGNYEGAVSKLNPTLGTLVGKVTEMSGGTLELTAIVKGGAAAIKTMTRQALAFIATPIGATLAALALAYKAVKNAIDPLNDAIKENSKLLQMQEREATRVEAYRVQEQKTLEKTASGWIKVKGAIGEAWELTKLFSKYAATFQFGKFWDMVKGAQSLKTELAMIVDMEQALHAMKIGDVDAGQLGNIEKVAKLEGEIAELRMKAQDEATYGEKEREEYLNKALAKTKELYGVRREELDLMIEIAEATHKASPDSREFELQYAELRAQRDRLNAEEANATRMLVRSLNKYVVDETATTAKEVEALWFKASEGAAKNAKIDVDSYTKELDEEMRTIDRNAEALAYLEELRRGLRKPDAASLEEQQAFELEELKYKYDEEVALFNRKVEEEGIIEETANAIRLAMQEKFEKDQVAVIIKYGDKKDKIRKKQTKAKQEEFAMNRELVDAASDLLGQNTVAGKTAAIASTTMSTYSAAQKAFESQITPGDPTSYPRGIIAMSTAILSGLANVRSILSVNTGGKGSGGAGGAAGAVSPIVNPPAVIQQIPITRTLTSASEEERLNNIEDNTGRAADPQRVYVVYSDIAEAGRQVQVQQDESSF